MTKIAMSWSSGKDSAACLSKLLSDGHSVDCLLTTVTKDYNRVSMHGVRSELLKRQAGALGLPLKILDIPSQCSNEIYQAKMSDMISQLRKDGFSQIAFGDLFLEDIRAYREQNMKETGIEPVFPLWGRDTRELSRQLIQKGYKCIVSCTDPRKVPDSLCGRDYDLKFLESLPDNVDPCGENGEFHTFITDGPDFKFPIHVKRGQKVTRDGFCFMDLTL